MMTSSSQYQPQTEADGVPRSFLACLPFLWSRVLFPGSTGQDRYSVGWVVLLVGVLPALLLYPCMDFYLFEPDEGRYAEIPREMLAKGEWVVPLLQSEPYLDKPPLLYWLIMGSFSIFGVHAWAARLVPALAVHATIALTFLLGRRSLGERTGLWGALLLALAPGFFVGRLLLTDGLLTLFVTLSILSAFEAVRSHDGQSTRLRWSWWTLSAVACGLAVLTKGPVGLILLIPPLWLYRRLTAATAPLGWRAVAAFGAVVTAIALPWYIAITVRLPEFAHYFLWEHNVVRFLFPFAHREPVWFFIPFLLAGLLPSTLFLIPFLRYLLSDRPDTMRSRSPEMGFMLIVGGWCVLFFSLSTCKLVPYVLPAFPFLCLAVGNFVAHTSLSRSRWMHALCAAAVVFIAVANYLVVPWVARVRSPMNRPHEVQAYCGDKSIPVVCYPRNLDSVAFYLGRDDLDSYRSKRTPELLQYLQTQTKTVVLFSHRHSLEQLKNALPPHMRLVKPTKLGLCDMAIVERID